MTKYLFILFAATVFAQKVTVNGTAATVGKSVLTLRDAMIYRALVQFKEREKYSAAFEEGEELKKSVQKLVFEEMAYLEMKELGAEEVERSAAEKIVREGKKAEWSHLLKRFSLTESKATDRLHRILQVERFLQKKVDTLTPLVTDAEIERYYQQNSARFRGSALDQLKPSISLLLRKQYAQKGLEDWVKFLKDKYRVQNQLDG